MKIVIISDTHSYHNGLKYGLRVPPGDILIHGGDISNVGERNNIENFMEWFKSQPHKYKIFIAGNNDKSFDPKLNLESESVEPIKPHWLSYILNNLPSNIYYLENSSVEIEGLKFWGSPYSCWFFGDRWAFNKHRGEDIKQVWDQIPLDTNVLITHTPVYGKLDYIPRSQENVGCEELKKKIEEIKPKLHISGHIHEGYGILRDEHTIYVNASIMDGDYNLVNKPIIVEI